MDKYIFDHNITVISPVKNQSPMTNAGKTPIIEFNILYMRPRSLCVDYLLQISVLDNNQRCITFKLLMDQ